MKSLGDLCPDLPLESPGTEAKTLFTGTLEQALADGRVDLCVHSLKDMAAEQPGSLPIAGMAVRGDPRDMLVLPAASPSSSLQKQDPPLPVGCSSLRRRLQFLALYPDFAAAPVRGNVPTRLVKLEEGHYSALVLAAAGINRLGIVCRGCCFSIKDMVPAAGQGVIALQGRRGEDYRFLDTVRDPLTEEEAGLERKIISALGGGCSSPAGAFVKITGNEILLTAMYSNPGSSACAGAFVTDELTGERERGGRLAEDLARRLLRKWADR
jgi:hydroxymethylbilane synthase